MKTLETENHLRRWAMPANYFGAEWPEYFVFLGQHRNSDSLTRSNFVCALEAIGGESETVKIVRESHWAVSWVEWIAIHESDHAALEKANEIKEKLEDYPVVDEDHCQRSKTTKRRSFGIHSRRATACKWQSMSATNATGSIPKTRLVGSMVGWNITTW